MTGVFVGLGSNIEPARNITSAVAALKARFAPLRLSPVFASAPIGFDGGEFYNLVAGFHTELAPEPLVSILDAIEIDHGRVPGSPRFASRTLDIDLLTYGDAVIDTPRLRLPRADIERYAFVLRGLAELAPEARHPVLGATYGELWAAFPAASQPLRVVPLELP